MELYENDFDEIKLFFIYEVASDGLLSSVVYRWKIGMLKIQPFYV